MEYSTCKSQAQADAVTDILASYIVIQTNTKWCEGSQQYIYEILVNDGWNDVDVYSKFYVSESGNVWRRDFYPVPNPEIDTYGYEQFHKTHRPEAAGDEPFDVAVNKIVIEENKMKEIKEEKKMAINFRELYSEAMLDAFKDYVRSNKEDLISYAEDTAKEKIIEHINDNIDLEDVAHNTIDEMIDYYIEYNGEGESEEELEQIICDYILE